MDAEERLLQGLRAVAMPKVADATTFRQPGVRDAHAHARAVRAAD